MITKAQAKKYSLIKWDYFRKTGKDDISDFVDWAMENKHKEIKYLKNWCGYCEKYIKYRCSKCPLRRIWGVDCDDDKSPYEKWRKAMTYKTRKKYAEKIYQDIKRSKP